MKEKKRWGQYIIGSLALTVGAAALMPKVIDTLSDIVYKAQRKPLSAKQSDIQKSRSSKN